MEEPRPISQSVDRVLRSLGNPGIEASRTVFSHWTELVGEAVAAHARPVSLDGGCLLVVVDDPAYATSFRYEHAGLLARFAKDLGPDVVSRIDVRVRR